MHRLPIGPILKGTMRNPVLLALSLTLPLLLAASGIGRAATLGRARIGFSAQRILVINGRRYVGKMWQMPGAQRHQQQLGAIGTVMILHADSTAAEILLPGLHTVVEVALPKAISLFDGRSLPHRPIARRRIDGLAAREYAIDENSEGGRAAGTLWLSRQGILLRCDGSFRTKNGKVTTIHWRLHNVHIAPQPASLFTVPRGYTRLPPGAVAPLLGLRTAKPAAR